MGKENELSLERIKRKLTLNGNDFTRFSDNMNNMDNMDLKLSELLEQLQRCGNEIIFHESALLGNYGICSYLFCRLFCFFFLLLRGSTSSKQSISSPRWGNLGNLGWECVAWTLKALAYTGAG